MDKIYENYVKNNKGQYIENLFEIMNPLHKYKGTYIGVCPTDGNNTGYGEFEIKIKDFDLEMRHKNYNEEKVKVEKAPTYFLEMNKDETLSLFQPTSDISRIQAFKGVGFNLVFIGNPKGAKTINDFNLIMNGTLHDILGQTILYSEDQVKVGLQEEIIDKINNYTNGSVPRLYK